MRSPRPGGRVTRWFTSLDRVSLTIEPGQIVAITGPSGAGKSSLLQLIGALDTPDPGTILVDSAKTAGLSKRDTARFRRGLGFVFQRYHARRPGVSDE
jgi:putative ABC transport system ATP-binding protein